VLVLVVGDCDVNLISRETEGVSLQKTYPFSSEHPFFCGDYISSLDKSVAACGIFPGFTDVTFQNNFVKKHVNVGM